MIRTAAFTTVWKGIHDCGSSWSFVAILGVTLWLHVYVENVASMVESNVNVCLVATPALSWLIYREYNTNGDGDARGSDCDGYGKPTTSHGIRNCDRTEVNRTKTGTGACRYFDCANGCDRLTHGQHRGLPDDVLIHVCSFLHPRDVTSLACVNRSLLEGVDGRQFAYNEEERGRAKNYYDYGHSGMKLSWKTRTLELKSTRKRSTSNQLWKALWYRDYGQVLLGWYVGREALRRSLQPPRGEVASSKETFVRTNSHTRSDLNEFQSKNKQKSFRTDDDDHILKTSLAQKLDTITDMKHFYFSFLETYLDYVLAGQNTPERCLLGMHGHIFDFTDFANHHPGLSEPIRLECGKDATQYFEDLPHSCTARKIARKLCVLTDRACLTPHPVARRPNADGAPTAGCGLHRPPASRWSAAGSNSRPPPRGDDVRDAACGLDRVLPGTSFTERRRAGSLRRVRDLFDRERTGKAVAAGRITAYGNLYASMFCPRSGFGGSCGGHGGGSRYPLITDMHQNGRLQVYYDPFHQRWKSWYTRLDFQPTYCELD